jgi:hypothetical protein
MHSRLWVDGDHPQSAKLPVAKKYAYERLADERFRPKIAKVFPFAQAVEAYYMESDY